MLHTVQLVYPAPVPILGVNAGQLGYLTALEPDELEPALPRLLAGDFTVSRAHDARGRVHHRTRRCAVEFALNEAVLEAPDVRPPRALRSCRSTARAFTTYAADGVIVATPTGSTAYSFSVRGPIVVARAALPLLTPISPHMLFDRSLVLAAHEELDFVVAGSPGGRCARWTAARSRVLEPGDRVTCRAADEPLRLVQLRPRDFHQILKAKFALPDR